jgi:hypothetical protein
MAYFVNIGASKENKSGVQSRGYHLFRRANHVIARWGAIMVTKDRKFYWCYSPQEEIYKYRSEQEARNAIQELIWERERGGYSRLPVGARIKQSQN